MAPDSAASRKTKLETTKVTRDFENVRDQIGYCGIWCGSCIVGNGTFRELTRMYERTIRDYDIKDWGPKDIDYEEFLKALSSIQMVSACPGCRKGGGRTQCEMRACATEKGIGECTECPEPEGCRNLKIIRHMREGALKAGLNVKAERGDRAEVIEKWNGELRKNWPSFVLFLDEKD